MVRKMNTEAYCFKPCDYGIIIYTTLGKIAVGICADNHIKDFYDRVAASHADLMLMPHAWATPYKVNKVVKQSDIDCAKENVKSLGQIYADSLGIPVAFINPVGAVPPMRGFLGSLITPDCYCLQGGSAVFSPGTKVVYYPEMKEGYLVADVQIGNQEPATMSPTFFDGWLHPGSKLARKIIIPLDLFSGRRHYQNSKVRKERAAACIEK